MPVRPRAAPSCEVSRGLRWRSAFPAAVLCALVVAICAGADTGPTPPADAPADSEAATADAADDAIKADEPGQPASGPDGEPGQAVAGEPHAGPADPSGDETNSDPRVTAAPKLGPSLSPGDGPFGPPRTRKRPRGLFDLRFYRDMRISGRGEFLFQTQSLSGAGQQAYYGQYYNTDMFEGSASLHIEGPLFLRGLSMKADVTRTGGFGLDDTRWVLSYGFGDAAIHYGYLNINLGGNQFANFHKQIFGSEFEYSLGSNTNFTGFYAREKGTVQRQSFAGNNTSGPYFLRFAPVLDGSEIVKVDEEVLRFGQDYVLYYETGQLYFEPQSGPPRIIPPTSTVSVSYQSLRGGTGQQLYGARVEHRFGRRGLIGFNAVEVRKEAGTRARDTAGYRRDIFNGAGSTGPFELNFRPVVRDGETVVVGGKRIDVQDGLLVTVDAVPQAENVDYFADYDYGVIEFFRIIPPTATVFVQYYYYVPYTPTTGGSRVMGLDFTYDLLGHRAGGLGLARDGKPRGGNLSYVGLSGEMAMGGPLEESGGPAYRLGVDARLTRKPKDDKKPARDWLALQAEYRNVSPDFAYVDTVGFQRHEQGINFRADVKPLEHIRAYFYGSDLKTNQGYLFGSSPYGYGSPTTYPGAVYTPSPYGAQGAQLSDPLDPTRQSLDVTTRRLDMGVDVSYPGWPTLRISRGMMSNRSQVTGESENTSLNIDLNYGGRDRKWDIRARYSLADQSFRRPLLGEDEGLLSNLSTRTASTQVSAGWHPSQKLALTADWGRNTSADARRPSLENESTLLRAGLRYNPSKRLTISLDRAVTESVGALFGSLLSGGYYGGYGGYGGYSGLPVTGYAAAHTPFPAAPLRPRQTDDGDGQSATQNRYTDSTTRGTVSYRPSDKLSLDLTGLLRTYQSQGTVGYRADSDQSNLSLSGSYFLSRSLRLFGTVGWDRIQFLDAGRGNVTNTDFGLGLSYGSYGRGLSGSVQYRRLNGTSPGYSAFGGSYGGAGSIATGSTDLSGNIDWGFSDRSTISLRAARSVFSGGFGNSKKFDTELSYEFKLNDAMGICAGYRFISNEAGPGGAGFYGAGRDYTASVFSVSLNCLFNRGRSGAAMAPGYGGYRTNLGAPIRPGQYGTFGPGFGDGYGTYDRYRTGGYGGYGSGGFGGMGGYGRYDSGGFGSGGMPSFGSDFGY